MRLRSSRGTQRKKSNLHSVLQYICKIDLPFDYIDSVNEPFMYLLLILEMRSILFKYLVSFP